MCEVYGDEYLLFKEHKDNEDTTLYSSGSHDIVEYDKKHIIKYSENTYANTKRILIYKLVEVVELNK